MPTKCLRKHQHLLSFTVQIQPRRRSRRQYSRISAGIENEHDRAFHRYARQRRDGGQFPAQEDRLPRSNRRMTCCQRPMGQLSLSRWQAATMEAASTLHSNARTKRNTYPRPPFTNPGSLALHNMPVAGKTLPPARHRPLRWYDARGAPWHMDDGRWPVQRLKLACTEKHGVIRSQEATLLVLGVFASWYRRSSTVIRITANHPAPKHAETAAGVARLSDAIAIARPPARHPRRACHARSRFTPRLPTPPEAETRPALSRPPARVPSAETPHCDTGRRQPRPAARRTEKPGHRQAAAPPSRNSAASCRRIAPGAAAFIAAWSKGRPQQRRAVRHKSLVGRNIAAEQGRHHLPEQALVRTSPASACAMPGARRPHRRTGDGYRRSNSSDDQHGIEIQIGADLPAPGFGDTRRLGPPEPVWA